MASSVNDMADGSRSQRWYLLFMANRALLMIGIDLKPMRPSYAANGRRLEGFYVGVTLWRGRHRRRNAEMLGSPAKPQA